MPEFHVLGYYSVLDYFFCSPRMSADNNVPIILNDGDNMSDHCAISVTVNIPAVCKNNIGDFSQQHCSKLLWDKANIDGYRTDLYNCLSSVELPMETLLCKECCDESHHADIEKYYNSILNCLTRKLCYRKDDRAMPPCDLYMDALKFSGLPDYAHRYYCQHFSWAFVPIKAMNVRTKFEVRSFTRS